MRRRSESSSSGAMVDEYVPERGAKVHRNWRTFSPDSRTHGIVRRPNNDFQETLLMRPRRTVILSALTFIVLTALASAAGAATHNVTVSSFQFAPSTLTIQTGDT